jgi:hypothetical protein
VGYFVEKQHLPYLGACRFFALDTEQTIVFYLAFFLDGDAEFYPIGADTPGNIGDEIICRLPAPV